MKKKNKKPILTLRNDGPVATPVSIPGVNSPLELKYSKTITPEIRYDPSKLPESVSIEGPKCPRCGTPAKDMVLYAVMGGNSLSKNHCYKCGHNWGPGE